MPETVIVTIRWNDSEGDFEIPSSSPVSTWLQPLCSVAKLTFPGFMVQGREVSLLYQGMRLLPEDVPGQCGIYDGSILELRVV